jgi:hypothetical protein
MKPDQRHGRNELPIGTERRVARQHLSAAIAQVPAIELLQELLSGKARQAGVPVPEFVQAPLLVEVLVLGRFGNPPTAGDDDELVVVTADSKAMTFFECPNVIRNDRF